MASDLCRVECQALLESIPLPRPAATVLSFPVGVWGASGRSLRRRDRSPFCGRDPVHRSQPGAACGAWDLGAFSCCCGLLAGGWPRLWHQRVAACLRDVFSHAPGPGGDDSAWWRSAMPGPRYRALSRGVDASVASWRADFCSSSNRLGLTRARLPGPGAGRKTLAAQL